MGLWIDKHCLPRKLRQIAIPPIVHFKINIYSFFNNNC